ncbi:MAG: hypothetical protein DCC67_05870 [Planctomycetota bacterium]|nr:MAG: hypothetical protein DCC67_05870 [Planctomycetota bacterium]
MAGLVCLLASGCATTRMECGDSCSDGCGAGRPRGVRPLLFRDGSRPCAQDVAGDCLDGGGAFGCGACDGCASGGACQRLAERIASGGCHGGLCPTGSYPEYPAFQQGPPVGQVAYPYYTTRGPRDFLLNNPPHIGPY